jgi:hypothetical protein
MQVASRIWCLWGIVVAAPGPTVGGGIPAKPLAMLGPLPIQLNLISLLTAWCLSEVIRYGFFALKELLGEAPYISTWLRWVAKRREGAAAPAGAVGRLQGRRLGGGVGVQGRLFSPILCRKQLLGESLASPFPPLATWASSHAPPDRSGLSPDHGLAWLAPPSCLTPHPTPPHPLSYSGFIMLYPIGVASELTMAWLALPYLKETAKWSIEMPNAYNFAFSYYAACVLAMITYIPGGRLRGAARRRGRGASLRPNGRCAPPGAGPWAWAP